ncbi:amine oxidase [Gamsiella multidivaricata]|uniref:amine oxidase n=1 Tax=Gamsiella multidivaricata TaxID=101098 RepID=UPI00221FC793|nr:amine oxidase [Gamsiella multidivaricata]KAI7829358.1 amine oxidase [Gamsiella multidivaricata]
MTSMTVQAKRVIVVGGGIAGIAAAAELSKNPNIHVTLLEARDRLGGRVQTHRTLIPASFESSNLVPQGSSAIAFDFGASWVHGLDPSNPLFPLLKTGLVEYHHTYTDLMFYAPGQPALPTEESDYYWKVVWDLLDEAQAYAAEHRESIPEEMSFLQWLTEYLEKRQIIDPKAEGYLSEKVKEAVRGLVLYWADENAIPLKDASMKYMDAEEVFPGEHCFVSNGYDRVVKVLASKLRNARVLLEHVVEKIDYSESEVKVVTNHGTFHADQVLITLPLGVLKAQSHSLFCPPLPSTKQHAIAHLGFGTMFKILLFFPSCFWPPGVHFINFLPSASTIPNTDLVAYFSLSDQQREALTVYMKDLANYSSLMPVYNISILIGYATNHAAELMERLSDEEARMVYLCQLAHYYPTLATLEGKEFWPKMSFMTRWNQDPFARGSYTSIPVGASPRDIEAFEIPVGARVYEQLDGNNDYEQDGDDSYSSSSTAAVMAVDDLEAGRVFFAGEHTSKAHFASVQGALITGRREAAKILGQGSFF